jgi:hypothetical protein
VVAVESGVAAVGPGVAAVGFGVTAVESAAAAFESAAGVLDSFLLDEVSVALGSVFEELVSPDCCWVGFPSDPIVLVAP